MPPRTNLTLEEMLPEVGNADHDPRYWCLPPVRDEPNGRRGRFPMYLVTQGEKVGVWHNWTVVQAMHCLLGLHPHPPAPQPAAQAPELEQLPNLGALRLETGTASNEQQDHDSGTDSPSSPSSGLTATDWEAVPEARAIFRHLGRPYCVHGPLSGARRIHGGRGGWEEAANLVEQQLR
ncbi:hypothetical protein MSAN_00610500 [Mycena sanguinolenta]|uniref:Uncharacterized protein n=1 Tax=Mycena sanguinolenta TaxID=230812 RepID=A0A8H7DI26_9AGAR|nr:hypothetical protein MSAN_00610500 [Mycena sanguinolenta]